MSEVLLDPGFQRCLASCGPLAEYQRHNLIRRWSHATLRRYSHCGMCQKFRRRIDPCQPAPDDLAPSGRACLCQQQVSRNRANCGGPRP